MIKCNKELIKSNRKNINKAIGVNIRKYLSIRNIKQKEVADMLGIHKNQFYDRTKGRYKISACDIALMANALGLNKKEELETFYNLIFKNTNKIEVIKRER